jgi:hypothetical protein
MEQSISAIDDYHLPEDDNHHSHRRGNLKSYIFQQLIAAQMASKLAVLYATRRLNAMCKGARYRTVS